MSSEKQNTCKQDRIIAELRYALTTPRHPDLRHDKDFLREQLNTIGFLFCQAEELGKQDYAYIVAQVAITKQQARDTVRNYRASLYLQEHVIPLVKRWDDTYQQLIEESHQMDDMGNIGDPSEKWEDLAAEWIALAHQIDSKTAAIRTSIPFPSYVEKSRVLIYGSMKLANPEMSDAEIKRLIRLKI